MKKIFEKSREIPIVAKSEVLVIGGGPAGFAAAISAAREGAKTILIEQSGDVGGVATSGHMSHWTGNTEGPLYHEILERSVEKNALKENNWKQTINTEHLKTLLLKMLSETGVQLKLYTFACDAIVEDNVEGSGLDVNGVQANFTQPKGYTIPYRCFIPRNIDGLFLVGRNISGTHKAHSNFRVMPICVNMGEGIGVAAALAAKEKIAPRYLEVKKVQDILLARGVEI